MPKLLAAAVIALALALPAAAPAADAGPQAALKQHVDAFIALIKDPRYAGGANKAEQDDKIWQVLDQAFDFAGVSRLAVGRGWRMFSPEQKKEFSKDFSHLLGNNYVKKIREEYSNEKVTYAGVDQKAEGRVVVRTEVLRKGNTFNVDYAMWQRNGAWRVYDVQVEGVSLIKNYRAQFSQMLLNHDPAYVIQAVKDKLAKQES